MDEQQDKDTSVHCPEVPVLRDQKERRNSMLVENDLSTIKDRARKASIEEVIEGIAVASGGSTSKNILKEGQEEEQQEKQKEEPKTASVDANQLNTSFDLNSAFQGSGAAEEKTSIGQGVGPAEKAGEISPGTNQVPEVEPSSSALDIGATESTPPIEALPGKHETTSVGADSNGREDSDNDLKQSTASENVSSLPWETEGPQEATLPWEKNTESNQDDFSSLINSEAKKTIARDDTPEQVATDEGLAASTSSTSNVQKEESLPWESQTEEPEKLPWEESGEIAEQYSGDTPRETDHISDSAAPAFKDVYADEQAVTGSLPEQNEAEFLEGLLKVDETMVAEGTTNIQSAVPVNGETANPEYTQERGRFYDHDTLISPPFFAEQLSKGDQRYPASDPSDQIIEKPRSLNHKQIDEEKFNELFAALDDEEPLPESKEGNEKVEGNEYQTVQGENKFVPSVNSETDLQQGESEQSKVRKPSKLLELELDDELLEDELLEEDQGNNSQPKDLNSGSQSKNQGFNQQTTTGGQTSSRSSKYAPASTNNITSPPSANVPSKLTQTLNLHDRGVVPQTKVQHVKPKAFFEELPISLPKPTRAARPVASLASKNHKANTSSLAPPHVVRDESLPTPIAAPAPALSTNTFPHGHQINNASNRRMPMNDNSGSQHIPHVSPVYAHAQLPITGKQLTPTLPKLVPFPGIGQGEVERSHPNPISKYAPVSAQPQPAPINTNVGKVTGSNNSSPYVPNASSPYVPNAGPYMPSNNNRTHSRASSLVGGKGKEINPYAPLSSTISSKPPTHNPGVGVPSLATSRRARGASNSRPGNVNKPHHGTRAIDSNSYYKRQFPIFNWNNTSKVTYLLPSQDIQQYGENHDVIKVSEISSILNDDQFVRFPGPLNKMKTKKKDVEKWISNNITKLENEHNVKHDEILLNQILLVLMKYESDNKSTEFAKEICALINTSVDYYSQPSVDFTGSLNVANAFKLDNGGVNIVFNLIQCGSIDKALEYAISRGDWAMSLILASFADPERFKKTASDFARANFPIQKTNNKINHLMPILLKVFSGNIVGVINDFTSVPSEGEWANLHWKDIISVIYVNGSEKANDFMCEFGKFLLVAGNTFAGEICFILGGLPFSSYKSQNGVLFSMIQSASLLYTEVYEYILTLRSSAPVTMPHLLSLKLKHASLLADYGYFSESQKYITNVNTIIKSLNKSPFVTSGVLHDFHLLIMRLTESGMTESGWFGSKISKVNLDKVWGQLDKFIGGDETKKSEEASYFSKYSPSVSRTNSVLDFTAPSTVQPFSSPQVPYQESRKNSTGSLSTYSAPATSETSKQLANVTNSMKPGLDSRIGAPPALVSRNSKSSISRYTPGATTPSFEPSASQQFQPAVNRYNPNISGDIEGPGLNSTGDVKKATQEEIYQPQNTFVTTGSNLDNQIDNTNGLAPDTNVRANRDVGLSVEQSNDHKIPSKKSFDYRPPHQNDAGTTRQPSIPVGPPKEAAEQSVKESPSVLGNGKETSSSVPPPPIASNMQPRSSLSNPYAPNSTRAKRSLARGKYINQSARNNISTPSGQNKTDNFSPKNNRSIEASTSGQSSKSTAGDNPLPEGEKPKRTNSPETPRNRFVQLQGNSQFSPSSTSFDPPKRPNLNIDDSFDEDDYDESKSSSLRTPQPKVSTYLHNYHSPPNNVRDSRFSPQQNGERDSAFGVDNRLGDFPIPGSPEITTRANSVIGGPTGLFSSRLSQSQSVLYQQYEVEDDTVNTYVPVVEEDEDEDDSSKKSSAKVTQNKRSTKRQRPESKEGQRTWYSWFGKTDDKNKPIKANLGNKNHFYYDEKLKRWIDSTRPVEEQVKKDTPPPLPKGRVPPRKVSGNVNSDKQSPPVGGSSEKIDRAREGDPNPKVNAPLPSAPTAPPSLVKAPSAPARSLANAGLDDLISIGSAPSVAGGSRRPRKGGKRGYVNVLDNK